MPIRRMRAPPPAKRVWCFERPDLALDERKALRRALELRLQFQGQRMAIPEREAAKPQPNRSPDGEPDALRHQQGLYAKPMRKPLALQTAQLPVKVPGVLFLGAWHAHHAPAAALARVIAHELHKQALPVEPIALHVAQSPAHLDAGSVHDLVLDTEAYQVLVQPEAVPAGIPKRSLAFDTASENFISSAAGTTPWRRLTPSLNASLQVLLLSSSAIYNTGADALTSVPWVAALIFWSPSLHKG